MRKKKMLSIIMELQAVHDNFNNRNRIPLEEMQEILMQCQNSAIILGNELETRGEKGELIVQSLEEYCECIYQLSMHLQEEQTCNKIDKKIRKLLTQVKNFILYDLPDDKREIVFFPYKASMWDSMESIWREASQDDKNEVYVVPIPYYDKNPNGSVKNWYYEGGEYPDDVPITSWEAYDLARNPEIIYIHNPYDEYNSVTSVHPRYYSTALKKDTDELIYVPYFVANDDVAEHFVTVPGVVNADKVIVQSEKVRNTYIRVFIDFVGTQQKKREQQTGVRNEDYWKKLHEIAENKFLALGSPKVEKVRNTKKDALELPEDWQRLLVGKAGKGKKVLLYNTTIDALLNNSDFYMEKIAWVLQAMKQQEEVVLLWRPHPLFQSTLDAMRPQLSAQYQQIVQQYRKEGWGIFDDTADVHRAIALSDAYYGDMSSLVAMYKETGKPMMIQNVEVRE